MSQWSYFRSMCQVKFDASLEHEVPHISLRLPHTCAMQANGTAFIFLLCEEAVEAKTECNAMLLEAEQIAYYDA
eukprot:1461514-Pleurochrysis_carterae.AAC.1